MLEQVAADTSSIPGDSLGFDDIDVDLTPGIGLLGALKGLRYNEWFALAEKFADEWDQIAFDPNYDTLPLEHFEERLRTVFATPHSI